MKPKFPYYRYVDYTSDGCSEYQCLACKTTWEARRMPTNYCGGCGIKFVGMHESKPRRDKLKWVWPKNNPESKWIIEFKQVWIEYPELSKDWSPLLDCMKMRATSVSYILKCYRAEELLRFDKNYIDGLVLCRDYFKAKLVPGDTHVDWTGAVPHPSDLDHIELDRQYWMAEQNLK